MLEQTSLCVSRCLTTNRNPHFPSLMHRSHPQTLHWPALVNTPAPTKLGIMRDRFAWEILRLEHISKTVHKGYHSTSVLDHLGRDEHAPDWTDVEHYIMGLNAQSSNPVSLRKKPTALIPFCPSLVRSRVLDDSRHQHRIRGTVLGEVEYFLAVPSIS